MSTPAAAATPATALSPEVRRSAFIAIVASAIFVGLTIGYVPPLWEPNLVDEVIAVPTAEAKEMARRLAREEALFGGTSTGANVIAAQQVADALGGGGNVVEDEVEAVTPGVA